MSEIEIMMALAVFLGAGIAKGLIGIGLPTITISLLVMYLEPRQAILLTLGPIFLINLWQSLRAGRISATLRRYSPFALSLAGAMFVTAQISQGVSGKILMLFLGGSVMVFSLVQLFFQPPELPQRYDRTAQIIAGLVAGVMGGMTAIWGPPVLIYLIARRTAKDEFIRATGVLLTLGAVPLLFTYWQAGILVGTNIGLTLVMVLPALAGFAIGERYRMRLNGAAFQKTVLWMFFLLGANILRRAL